MKNAGKSQQGFSYLDVLIATSILLIGVLALGAALTTAIVRTTESEDQLRAKQHAASTLESIFASRDIRVENDAFSFDYVQNVSSGGIFLDGVQSIYATGGPDGVVGTGDDGSDGSPAIPGYTRQIAITDVPNPNRPSAPISMRRIDVTVFYLINGRERQETLTTFIANYNE